MVIPFAGAHAPEAANACANESWSFSSFAPGSSAAPRRFTTNEPGWVAASRMIPWTAFALTELVAAELAGARFLDRSFEPFLKLREALALRGSAEPRFGQP